MTTPWKRPTPMQPSGFYPPLPPPPDVRSDIVITARGKEDLEETKRLVTSQAPGISVHVVTGDLEDMQALPTLFSQLLAPLDTTKHKQGLLIHNAGSIDDFETPFLSLTDPEKIQNFFCANVTSMMTLTTRFISAFPTGKHYMVHITSLLGKVFVPGFPLYSTSRAARNAFMGVLMAEMPSVRQLNYSPGVCDTDMFRSIPEKFKGGFMNAISPEQTTQKLVKILKEDEYENGSTIDYCDV